VAAEVEPADSAGAAPESAMASAAPAWAERATALAEQEWS
jgi:hypothetical protein